MALESLLPWNYKNHSFPNLSFPIIKFDLTGHFFIDLFFE